MKAGAHQGGVIIEKSVGDGGRDGQSHETLRQSEGHACEHGHECQSDEAAGKNGKGRVERGAQFRPRAAAALGIEADRREPDPIEGGGLDDDGHGERQREPAKLLRPQELRDQETDGEVEQGVDEESEDDFHAAFPSAHGRRPPTSDRWLGVKLMALS